MKIPQSGVISPLPEEHKLKENEIYYVSQGSNIWIGKYISDNDESDTTHLRGKFHFLFVDHFYRKGNMCYYSYLRSYRLATFKERRWLECCIENGRYITEKEFNVMFRKEKINKLLDSLYYSLDNN